MTANFSELSTRLRRSDPSACTELFRLLHEPLLGYASRLIDDEDVVYDVVQESFIKLWEHRDRIDPERSLKAYLYQIVRNTAFDYYQANKKERRIPVEDDLPIEDPSPPVEDEVAARDLGGRIRAWIREMPPRRQEAFRLSREEGLTHEEIARIMDLAPRTVTVHVMLALQYLKGRLEVYQGKQA